MKLRITVTAEFDIPVEEQPKQTDQGLASFKSWSEFEARKRARRWFGSKTEPRITATSTIEL